MTSIAVNEENDIFLDADGNLSMVSGIQAVLEDCEHAMQAQRGEMIFAADQGIPTAETVTQSTSVPAFESAARIEIEAVDNVARLVSIETTIINDVLSYVAVIETTFGIGEING